MANTVNHIRIQALIKAHNNALRQVIRTRNQNPEHRMPHRLCLTGSCRGTPANNRANRARQAALNNYKKAYNNLKRALRQPIHLPRIHTNNNNNNLYNFPVYGPNHGRPTSNWANLGNAGRAIRAATTIQRHVRGTQLRRRAGVHNPHTPVGYVTMMKKMKRNFSTK
jgi:hypothetical protein